MNFIQKTGLEPKYLLQLGMDVNVNVNKAFELSLLEQLQSNFGTTFLKLGSCPLHKMHNCFKKGVNTLKEVDVEQFITDLHSFLKYSSARRDDYSFLQDVTDVAAWCMLRFVSSRWLSMKPALLRILDQWENLKAYFLDYLPSQKEFRRTVQSTERYKRICIVLRDPLSQAYFAFVTFVCQYFESFLLKFQKREPMIHVLHTSMTTVLLELMQKFVKEEMLVGSEKTEMSLKAIAHYAKLDVTNPANIRSNKKIDIGTKTVSFLMKNNVSEEDA